MLMRFTVATSFFLLCQQTSASFTSSARLGRRLPAFCSTTNSSTSTSSRQSRRPTVILPPLRATEDKEVLETIVNDSEDKEMGTWNPFSLAVLKLGFTEPAWTSPFNYKKATGMYLCANCRSPLFPSSGKFDSGSGWPSFWKTIDSNRVTLERQWDGRMECTCASCGGHLGHVFPDGPTRGSLEVNELATVPKSDPQIGYKVQGKGDDDAANSKYSRMPRYCVNGVALRFEEEKQ